MKTDKNSVKITAWIPVAEATKFIKDAIAEGKYKKGEIRKSSYRWADPKDHSKGYLCRVLIPAAVKDEEPVEEPMAVAEWHKNPGRIRVVADPTGAREKQQYDNWLWFGK